MNHMHHPSKEHFRWISSGGGPYVCAEPYILKHWRGSDSLSLPVGSSLYKKIKPTPLVEGWSLTDYSYACSLSHQEEINNIGLLPGYNRDQIIIIIGGDPSNISWRPIRGNSGYFIKWLGADDDDQIHREVDKINDDSIFHPITIFDINMDQGLVAFDSSYTIDDINDNFLQIDLPAGKYFLEYKLIDNGEIEIELIRFRPVF